MSKWIGPYGVLPPGREGKIVREDDTMWSYSWMRGAYIVMDGGVLDLGIVREETVDPMIFTEVHS